MKRLVLILLLAAFVCSPLITTETQAAQNAKPTRAAKVERLKQKVDKLKAKLHQEQAQQLKLAHKKHGK